MKLRWAMTRCALLLAASLVATAAQASLTATKGYSGNIVAGNEATMTIVIDNNPPPGNPGTLSFTDIYPAGVVNTSTPVANTCGGTASGSIGGNSLTLSGGNALSGNQICFVRIRVTACTAGSYSDNVQVFSTGTNDPVSNTATLTVTGSATASSASLSTLTASPASVLADGSSTSTLTATLRTACNTAASGKTVTIASGSANPQVSPASVVSNASGVASFTVRSSVAETVTFSASVPAESVTLEQTAQVTFTRLPAPTLAKSFSPVVIAPGASSTLEIAISNPNSAALGGLAFTDTFPAGLQLASGAVVSNSCGGSASATSGSLSLSGGSLAGNGSCSVSVAVTATTPAGYLNDVGPATSANAFDSNTASATLTVESSVDAFNAVASGADPVDGRLFTKLVQTGFGFDVVALDDSDALATGFEGDVTVELVDARSGDCSSYPVAHSLGTVVFTASNGGRRAVGDVTVGSAWSNLRVRISHDSGGSTIVSCSGDAFAIRPVALSLSSTTANADSLGSSATQTPTVAAGTSFSLDAQGGSGYTGTPKFDSDAELQAHADAVRVGNLDGSFAVAASGSASGTFTYDEVGYVRLPEHAVFDDDFTVVDPPGTDCLDTFDNTADGSGRYGCKFGNIGFSDFFGRFVPHHFDVAITDGCTVSSGDDYTYSGQPFTVGVGARNAAGSTTQNYQDDFAREVTLSSTNSAIGSVRAGTDTMASTAFALGVGSSATVKFDFVDSPSLPAEVKIRAIDSEGASSDGYLEGEVSLRSGRLRLLNAFGRGTQPLLMPMRIEYYRALDPPSGRPTWDLADTDDCTVLANGDFSLVGDPPTTVTGVLFDAGKGSLTLSAPGAGSYGDTTVTANLDGAASWLQFDWNDDGTAENPEARATWEINPGNQRQIYRREVVR